MGRGGRTGGLTASFAVSVALAAVVAAGCGSGSAGTARPSSTYAERPSGPPVQAHGAFLLGVGGGAPDYTADVYLVDAAGGGSRLVAKGVDDYGEPSWSPDGTRVLASAVRHGSGSASSVFGLDVVSYPVAGGRPLDLTPTRERVEQGPQWSPDGTRVAFISGTGIANFDYDVLDVVPATGGRSHYVHETSSFAWSPDGRQFAFTWNDAASHPPGGVWVVPASGGRDRPLETGEADFIDEWGHGGRLLYGVECPGQAGCGPSVPSSTHLWTGTKDEEIGDVDDAQFLADGTVAYLDGRRLGFVHPDGSRRIVEPLPVRATSAAWSPDGRYLAFAATSTGRVYVARADGGGARPIPLTIGRTRKISVFGWRPRP